MGLLVKTKITIDLVVHGHRIPDYLPHTTTLYQLPCVIQLKAARVHAAFPKK